MEREEERERRRLRDRQRRQSMTKEQRERHLARRRRNYQLRRQRAANTPLPPLPQSTSSQPSVTTAGHLRSLPPSIPSQNTLQIIQGNSGTTNILRLNSVKRLARSLSFPVEKQPSRNIDTVTNS
ncbi:hypothetical protein LR48_Vigan01g325400 [Vigna angularis]|uniref:Uncharacterized protein n=1 Tax=Phaseolus angularis TaxID=3914 RepID=A0A0L9TSX3_PHAAN|nr:hypothetical protein LR48_Vigan01g325400 [Vigna angularis]